MTFVPFSRILTVVMAGVVCFGLIVPLALTRHNAALAAAAAALYFAYVGTNVYLWRRMRT